tara:strand:- start:669 stop:878 length:210 start_codon:yes stop_codon:yes gene_type:complete
MNKYKADSYEESEIIIDLYIRRMIDDNMDIDDAVAGALANPLVKAFWNQDELEAIFSREIQEQHTGVKH